MSELVTVLALLFIVAGVLVFIASQLSLPPLPFYILAGLIVGTVVEPPEILELAQWGIAFLVFVFGVRVEFGSLSGVLRDGEVLTGVQVIVVGGISFVVGLILGFGELNALYFAIAATLGSTLIGVGLREVEIRDNLVHGRLAESVHFLQDLLAIGFVLVLSANVFEADVITSKIGYGVLLLVGAVLIRRHIFGLLTRLSDGSQELMLMASISILIGFLAISEYVGVSIVVGAFAAGLAIEREFTHNLEMFNGIESIKDFFVAIFFVTLGALVSVPTVDVFLTAVALIVLTAVVTPIVMAVTLLWEGYDARTATLTSLSLDQVSEFSLIIAIEALIIGLIAPELFDAIILAAAFTMITSSYTRRHDRDIYEKIVEPVVGDRQTRKIDERSRVEDDLTDHVIIVGFGRQGRWLVHECKENGHPYVVVENDPSAFDLLTRRCQSYVLGDAMYNYTWEKARVDEARLIVSTVNQRWVSDRVLEEANGVDAVVRTSSAKTARELLDSGATYVVVPDVLAGDRLLEHVTTVIEDPSAREELREEHFIEFETLEGLGLSSIHSTQRP